MQIQVNESHYRFQTYMHKERWISLWHQIDEIIKQNPGSALEIGPGSGLLKNALQAYGLPLKTADIDPNLNPDYLGSADNLPIPDHEFDVVCAFQVLEHMPFDISMNALREMQRIARRAIIISLPDATPSWATTLNLPMIRTLRFALQKPIYKPPKHKFDGEHYWEIGKRGYLLGSVLTAMESLPSIHLSRTYRVHENQYHRFFIFEKL